jgi:hypothetical protein
VAIESVTDCELVPGVIVADGAKDAVAPVGRPLTEKVMGLTNGPLEGATAKLKTAACPALTLAEGVDAVTV